MILACRALEFLSHLLGEVAGEEGMGENGDAGDQGGESLVFECQGIEYIKEGGGLLVVRAGAVEVTIEGLLHQVKEVVEQVNGVYVRDVGESVLAEQAFQDSGELVQGLRLAESRLCFL